MLLGSLPQFYLCSLPPQDEFLVTTLRGCMLSASSLGKPLGVLTFPSEHVHFICVVRACLSCQTEIHMEEQSFVRLASAQSASDTESELTTCCAALPRCPHPELLWFLYCC